MAKKKVGIYCGHGKSIDGSWDSGCTYKKGNAIYTEAELMLPITTACVQYLRGSKIKVYEDIPKNNRNMIQQVEKSNKYNVALHVAFHCDYSKAPKGTIPLYYSSNGRALAKHMNTYICAESGLTTRGLSKRTDLYELKATDMPAVIFEVGSIKEDLKIMLNKADAIGKGAAKGICKYLGVKFTGKKKL